jgi:dimethylamine corrinoid protein
MYEALDILLPLILKEAVREEGIITIGVVEGDVHDIGKNIVKTLLAAAGYEIIDLGRDVPADKFIDAVSARKAQVVAMSTLMTPTMDSMKNTVDALEQAGLRSSVLVIIGGAPTSQEFATEIGAELHATNAQEAVKKMKRATRSGTLI